MADSAGPAIATTKRKFYKLLDGFNSSTSVNTTTAPFTSAQNEPASKRTRLSVDSDPSRRSASVRVIGSHVLARTSDGTVVKAAAHPASVPNYQPYSQDAFLGRLKTFSDVKIWTYKPGEISEVEWAKRGWVCEAKQVDTVACRGGCEARVVIRLELGRERVKTLEGLDAGETDGSDAAEQEQEQDNWDGTPDDELVKRYTGLIVEGHREGCLWRTGGCKNDIYRIRMVDAAWREELLDRYQSLMSVASSLPDQTKLPGPDSSEFNTTSANNATPALHTVDQLASLLSDVLAPPPTTTPPNAAAAALALFGWRGSSPHNIHLATCDRCFQRIGLWLYTSDPSNKALPSAQSGIADDDILAFDVAGLHRDYCPWVSGESQAGLGTFGGLAAWEIIVQLVRSQQARERSERRSIDHLESGAEVVQKTRSEQEKEDRERESRLAKLKRVFTVRKPDGKKENRKSWRSLGR